MESSSSLASENDAYPVQLRLAFHKKRGKKRSEDVVLFENRRQMGGFDRPTFGVHSHHSEGRFLYIGEQGGGIWEIDLFTTTRGTPEMIDDPAEHAGLWAFKEKVADLSPLFSLNVKSSLETSAYDERGLLGMTMVPYTYDPSKDDPVVFFAFVSTQDKSVGSSFVSEGVDHVSCVMRMEAKYNKTTEGLTFGNPLDGQKMLCVAEPYVNHNGGNLLYDDVKKYLYVGLGDGGSQGDPWYRAQRETSPMGKILRLDVSDAVLPKGERKGPPIPYDIPRENVFAKRKERGIYGVTTPIYARQQILFFNRAKQGYNLQRSIYDVLLTREDKSRLGEIDKRALLSPLPEIFAYGLRNPWGMSFQPKKMDEKKLAENRAREFAPPSSLIVTDVGENRTEEVNMIMTDYKGEVNMGWPLYEGGERTQHHKEKKTEVMEPLFPRIVYHNERIGRDPYVTVSSLGETDFLELRGRGIVGGYVYTGSFSSRLYGTYVFGDVTGWYVAVKRKVERKLRPFSIVAYGHLPEGHALRAFCQLNDGEIYALSQNVNKRGDDGVFHIYV